MKRIIFLVMIFLLITFCGCNGMKDEVYVAKVDIIDDILLDDKTLELEFFSFESYDDIKCILEDETIDYKYNIIKNIEKKDKDKLLGYVHKIILYFDTIKELELNEVVLELDDVIKVFNIGSYKIKNVLNLDKKYYSSSVFLEILYPKDLKLKNDFEFDMKVYNFMDYNVSTVSIDNLSKTNNYNFILKEQALAVSSNTYNVGNSIRFASTNNYMDIKTYLLYTYSYKITSIDELTNYIKFEIDNSILDDFTEEDIKFLSKGFKYIN